jgi:hypothetical protein
MRSIKLPELTFTNWVPWDQRNTIPDCQFPGVYLLAASDLDLTNSAPKWSEVSYIGMTNSQGGLYSRWNQFNNSLHEKPGHSGGHTAVRHYGVYPTWTKKLFVAAHSIKCDPKARTSEDLIKMGWVAFLEYEAFSIYASNNPKVPKPEFNTK